jgi:pimeloyl-ACP methyl ester carboxylesterase
VQQEFGQGPDVVVFEAGQGCGRTCWDPVVPLLADRARLVAYDRAGFGRSGRLTGPESIDAMAADLAALAGEVASGGVVLVAHSMDGLIARRAAASLGDRLRGLLLVDPTPETAPAYDDWDATARRVDHSPAQARHLVRARPPAWLLSGNVRKERPCRGRRHGPFHPGRTSGPGRRPGPRASGLAQSAPYGRRTPTSSRRSSRSAGSV